MMVSCAAHWRWALVLRNHRIRIWLRSELRTPTNQVQTKRYALDAHEPKTPLAGLKRRVLSETIGYLSEILLNNKTA